MIFFAATVNKRLHVDQIKFCFTSCKKSLIVGVILSDVYIRLTGYCPLKAFRSSRCYHDSISHRWGTALYGFRAPWMCVCNTELGTSCDTTVATIWHWVKVAVSRDFSAFFLHESNPPCQKIWISLRRQIFQKNHVSLFISGPGGLDSWRKKANKSRDTVTLSPALLLQHACHCSIFVFQFIFNLMACGKGNANQPIEDFITQAGQLDARADANDARADANDARADANDARILLFSPH